MSGLGRREKDFVTLSLHYKVKRLGKASGGRPVGVTAKVIVHVRKDMMG